jgi:hypothetical protein
VRAAKVDEDNHAGYWEHPSLIFFVEKNRGAKTELLEGLYNNGVDWSGGARSSMATEVFNTVSLWEACR